MADGYCDFGEEQHGRNWILTRLSPPTTIELCDEHIGPGLIPLLAFELGVDFDRLYTGIQKILERESKLTAKELAAAEAAEAARTAGGEPAPAGDDDDAASPEIVDNDGVTVIVPDTRGAAS